MDESDWFLELLFDHTWRERERERERLSKRKGGEKWSAMDDSEKRKVKGDEKEEEEVQEKVQKIWWGEMKGVLLNRLGEMVQTSSPSCFEESLIMLLRGWIRGFLFSFKNETICFFLFFQKKWKKPRF